MKIPTRWLFRWNIFTTEYEAQQGVTISFTHDNNEYGRAK